MAIPSVLVLMMFTLGHLAKMIVIEMASANGMGVCVMMDIKVLFRTLYLIKFMLKLSNI